MSTEIHVPKPVQFPDRLLCGPGPSNVHPAVMAAMAHPIVGHLDPAFLTMLDEIGDMLRLVFGSSNHLTFPVSGTGSAGMEAAFTNLVEHGDTVVVGVNGVFGERMVEVATRCGADVIRVDSDWGRPVNPDQLADAVRNNERARVVAAVHAETSTGSLTDIAACVQAVRGTGSEAFFVADTVTSLAGIEVTTDTWGVDVAYSGTQKCLSVPPGLAPITFSERAVDRITSRKQPPQSWYLDVTLIARYLDAHHRVYHHTAPVVALCGLHEGLRQVLIEGIEARCARHHDAGARLQAVLQDRGFRLFAEETHRLPQLTTVLLPDHIEDAPVRRRLLMERGIEIGGGLGPWTGKLWRIGLMGENATDEVVDRLLDALPR